MKDLSKQDERNYELLGQLLEFLDCALYTLDDMIEDSETPDNIKRMTRARQSIYQAYNCLSPVLYKIF